MNIAVINGSPKGEKSVTLQYVKYLAIHFPHVSFNILNIGKEEKKITTDSSFYQSIIHEIKTADALLWATPVYYMLVPAQLKKFIELVFINEDHEAFGNKSSLALVTSIHFFDHTASRYLHAISEDLGMKHYGSYTAAMNDLSISTERKRLLTFFDHMLEAIKQNKPYSPYYPLVRKETIDYKPGLPDNTTRTARKVLILFDSDNDNSNLAHMVNYISSCFEPAATKVNFGDLHISKGCLGCLACGSENRCIYQDKDQYHGFFEASIRTADILIIAGAIYDRFLSAEWKRFMDRSFYLNHVPYLTGKQVGIIISGPLRDNMNIREVMEAYAAHHGANLAGLVTDQEKSSADIDRLLSAMAVNLVSCAKTSYVAPASFPQVGGFKIFRDFIAGQSRIVFPADYRYYRRHGYFNYPGKKFFSQIIISLLYLLLKIPPARREFTRRIIPGMLQPLVKIIDQKKAAEKKK